MKMRQMLVRAGNENRILEMHEAGFGVHQISGIFKDHGIQISAKSVAGVIDANAPLSSKALPKSVVRAAIQAQGGMGGMPVSAA
jgi:hypothetical protein